MLENSDSRKPVRYLLVIIAVVGLILAGWLTGHIVRHITPAFQRPPREEVNPHIKTGYFTGQEAFPLRIGCLNTTYYTSLPAKCHTPNGQLVRVEDAEPRFRFILPDK